METSLGQQLKLAVACNSFTWMVQFTWAPLSTASQLGSKTK